MAKKQKKVGDMFEGAKNLASSVVEAVEGVAVSKQYERIVPVPQVDTYSELPFALVEKAGKRVSSADPVGLTSSTKGTAAKPKKSKKTSRATKNKVRKKTSKKNN